MGMFSSSRATPGRLTPATGGLIGGALQYLVARKVIGRVSRVGGIQGVLLGAAASYAINKFFERRDGRAGPR